MCPPVRVGAIVVRRVDVLRGSDVECEIVECRKAGRHMGRPLQV
ncbi:hypothetical protein [Gimesia aquarii]|uniref:Uncharacterized protein n=1 Tax=Gimesia aquarii TaxID=2527964 RepID=A0A517WVS9_9PLAN|nr:hypothetical protein [Gimesia aquarii]QDU09329.1 hypothetical protein V202x_27020 [Gimesia aquarii]